MTHQPFNVINNALMIGQHKVSDLARQYQTPLYVMDEARIRSNMKTLQQIGQKSSIDVEFVYASKAFLNLAMVDIVHEEGLSLDVVSGGELYTAIKRNFPPHRLVFHGNNKSNQELQMALDYQVGTIVLDNPTEFEKLKALQPKGIQAVMLRVNPELLIDTHAYITTAHHDSKFGMSLADPKTLKFIQVIAQDSRFDLKGLHVHIGSQIQDINSFTDAIDSLLNVYEVLKHQVQITLPWINCGGGFGVAYTAEDIPLNLSEALPVIIEHILSGSKKRGLMLEKILFEPGRSLVAQAGITVYQVDAIKTTGPDKQYVFIDGSMADHIRTALYQAKYSAALIDRMHDDPTQTYTIAGKACESGDILIHEAQLPEVKINDYLCIFTTGAYHYSMSSHYNRLPKPAVIFVKGDQVRVVNQRETYEDLIRQDVV